MGGFFGITSTRDCMEDVYFGTDYHSHLGAHRAGLSAYSPQVGLQCKIHNIQNSPFRTKFENIFNEMSGTSAIGCISDTDPQPLMIRSRLGVFSVCTIGIINNADELIKKHIEDTGFGYFDSMTGGRVNTTELFAALINRHGSFEEGIRKAQEAIDGTANVLILKEDGSLIAARDRLGRLPVLIGRREDGHAVSFESFALGKLGFEQVRELGPGEIVRITPEGITTLAPAGEKKRICAFLWSYYGYPTSTYEGVNVEMMRYRNGAIMAKNDAATGKDDHIDYVGGVPDSGTAHAIGYANESHMHYARAFIKYTPTWARSFLPSSQRERHEIAKMKQVPVKELIQDKDLLFVDDSIVRGTQLQETVEFLYENGARSVHIRSACPPIMYPCKYLNFSRSNSEMELLVRSTIQDLEGKAGMEHLEEYSDGTTERGRKLREAICEKMHLASLEFQTLEGVVEAIGLPQCELCTYCWNGKE